MLRNKIMVDLESTTIEKLKELQNSSDTEVAHWDADKCLCDFLSVMGYKSIVEEYEKVNKWFA